MSTRLGDDIPERKRYKEGIYGDKKSTQDEYTKKRIFKDSTKHPSESAGEIDHVRSIAYLRKRYPHLTDEQLTRIANRNENLPATHAKLNQSKGSLSNIEYINRELLGKDNCSLIKKLKKDVKSGDIKGTIHTGQKLASGISRQSVKLSGNNWKGFRDLVNTGSRMIPRQIVSEITEVPMVAVFTAENCYKDTSKFIVESGVIDAATHAALFAAAFSSAKNIIDVAAGRKEIGEAAKDIAKTTFESSGSAIVLRSVTYAIGNPLLNESTISAVATGIASVGDQVYKYLSGEIDGEQLVTNVAENTALIAAGYIGKDVGAFLGSGIGMALGSLIAPGAGTAIGADVGALIGSVVGQIVTTMICKQIISVGHTIKDALRYQKRVDRELAEVKRLCARAEREIRLSKKRLELIIRENNDKLRTISDEGMDELLEATFAKDYDRFYAAILSIGSMFGLEEEYLLKGTLTKANMFDISEEVVFF